MTALTVDKVVIDPEFRRLLPAMRDEELRQLAANVEADGKFTDPLIVWKGHGILLDGHNRHDVWSNLQPGSKVVPPEIIEVELPDRAAAIKWIIEHQDGRRNWTEKDREYALGKKYNEVKRPAGRPENNVISSDHISGNEPTNQGVSDDSAAKSTAEVIAEEEQVSAPTVRRAGKFADAMDRIYKFNAKAGEDIKSGVLKISKSDVVTMSKLVDADLRKALKNLRVGRKWNDNGSKQSEEPDKSPAELAAKNRTLAKSLIDKAARAVCDLHEVKPNRATRDKVVKLLQEAGELVW